MSTWPLEWLAVASVVFSYLALDRAVLPLDP